MRISEFIDKDLISLDRSLIVVSICFLTISFYAQYITTSFAMLLVQWRIDNHIAYNSFATVSDYMDALPSWLPGLYDFLGYLSLALLVWIGINILHWIVSIVYKYWLADQKEKYPLSY